MSQVVLELNNREDLALLLNLARRLKRVFKKVCQS